ANYHWNDWLTLVGGLRVDNNQVRGSEGYGTQWSSRLAVVATPGPPGRNWILKAIFSNAFKDADNQAKYSTLSGIRDFPNPNLKLEKVVNYEGSVGKQITPTLFADVVVYYARYNRVIGTQDVPCVEFETPSYQCSEGATTSQRNGDLGPLEIGGLQSTLSFEWPSTLLGWQVSGYANYTFTDPYSTDFKPEPDSTLGRRRIGDIASHRVNVGLNGRRKRLNVNVRMNYVGDRKTGAETTVKGNPFDEIDAYTVFHAAVSFEINGKATVQLVGNNLFNKQYYHPGGRTARGSFASRLPQDERQLLLRLLLTI
ncbi:MAG: TonB-dependent receptor, partial [Acidobacteriota bacterium]